MRSLRARRSLAVLVAVGLVSCVVAAEDWPEFRGKGRVGVWNESGILETFPKDGLKVLWRTPIKAGYSGPAVADGRVFVVDFAPASEGSAQPEPGAIGGALSRYRG